MISSKHFSTRNIYFEKSKADDFQFIMDLIKKIEQEIPQADMTNVNIAGTLNIWHNKVVSLNCHYKFDVILILYLYNFRHE